MPTRKQRRREQKLRRHEWEEVYVDAEGNELEIDPAELEAERRAAKETARKASAGKPAQKGQARGVRAGREVKPASWGRVLRRAGIFAPIMFVVVFLIGGKLTTVQKVTETAFLLLMFVPFSYLMDSLAYRTYLRRTGQAPPARQPRRRRGGPETGNS